MAKSATTLSAEKKHQEVPSGELEEPVQSWPENNFLSLWGTRIACILFGILAALGIFEVAFRLLSPLFIEHHWKDIPKTYFLPEGVGNDRDFSYSSKKPKDVYRVVVVGDSFTFGGTMQIFDTFPKQLERYLNLNRKQPKVEVINYSNPGTATVHHLRMIDSVLKKYEPDLIILQITLNDPEPVPYRVSHKAQGPDSQIMLMHPIFQYWKSLAFTAKRILATQSHKEYKNYYFSIFEKRTNWIPFRDSLTMIARHAAERKVRFGAVVFPLFDYPLDGSYPFQNLHQKIHSVLESASIPYVDLFNSFRDIPPSRLQAIPGKDSHPNEIANRIAAEEIYQWLATNHFVPDSALVKRTKKNRVPSKPKSIGDEDEG